MLNAGVESGGGCFVSGGPELFWYEQGGCALVTLDRAAASAGGSAIETLRADVRAFTEAESGRDRYEVVAGQKSRESSSYYVFADTGPACLVDGLVAHLRGLPYVTSAQGGCICWPDISTELKRAAANLYVGDDDCMAETLKQEEYFGATPVYAGGKTPCLYFPDEDALIATAPRIERALREWFGDLLAKRWAVITLCHRIQWVNSFRWVDYPAAAGALGALNSGLRSRRQDRIIIVVAEAENGKTALMRRFVRDHRARELDGGGVAVPTIRVGGRGEGRGRRGNRGRPGDARRGLPALDREGILWGITKEIFSFPRGGEAETPARRVARVIEDVRRLGVKMLVLDRADNLPCEHRAAERRAALDLLSQVRSEAGVRLALFTRPRAADFLTRHFTAGGGHVEVVTLPPWEAAGDEYYKLLDALGGALPLKGSNDLTPFGDALHRAAGGRIGRIIKHVNGAAVRALRDGREAISADDWREVLGVN